MNQDEFKTSAADAAGARGYDAQLSESGQRMFEFVHFDQETFEVEFNEVAYSDALQAEFAKLDSVLLELAKEVLVTLRSASNIPAIIKEQARAGLARLELKN